jgi:ATP-dependent protease ClpP protease subunit
MQSQIYRILAQRSGRPLRQIIRDTKRTDLYLDAVKAKEYGLIDDVLGLVDSTVATSGSAESLTPASSEPPAAAEAPPH